MTDVIDDVAFVEKKSVEVALVESRNVMVEDAREIMPAVLNVCSAVHALALPKFKPMVRAVEPL